VCFGGSHRFASALARAFVVRGGTILDSAEVVKVLTKNGEAAGVEMADGRTIEAGLVASSLDPVTNFERLLGDAAPPELADRAATWQWDKWSLFTTHLVLKQPPRYKKTPRWFEPGFMNLVGFDGMEEALQLFADVEEGKLPKLGGHFTCLTDFDATFGNLAANHPQSDGPRSVCTFQMPAPFDMNWEAEREPMTREVLAFLQTYLELDVDRAFSETPHDIARRLPNMRRGSIKHGDYSPLQMGYFRPDTSCLGGRTPVPGFYVCGASSYPGGMVIGGPGYIAARTMLADAGKTPPPYPKAIHKYLSKYAAHLLEGV
jgi:phytoene dehydrogenase-like protein